MTTDLTTPIFKLPEVQEKVQKVMCYIDNMVRAKNLFAWKFFIEDLKVDAELEIYKYEDLHRHGKYKATGVGGYCNLALQLALNYAAYYSAKKRKGNFETLSLDMTINDDDGSSKRPAYDPPAPENGYANVEMLMTLEAKLSPEIFQLVKRVYDGETLSNNELKLLRRQTYLKEMLKNNFTSDDDGIIYEAITDVAK